MKGADWREQERREALTRMRLIVWVVGVAAAAIWWIVRTFRG